MDDKPSHGEVPGTQAFKARLEDAEPDEVEVVHENDSNGSSGTEKVEGSATDHPIPTTVVEKVDPDVPNYGDVPGTAGYDTRQADAEPDVIMKAPETSRMDLEGKHYCP